MGFKFAHKILDRKFFARSALQVAPDLVGCVLCARLVDGREVLGVIFETEAYLQSDPASDSFKGCTQRNVPMFGPPGHAYVYLIYGMYHGLNVVTGCDGEGEAVLIRAVDISMSGEHFSVGAGPGKVCRHLNVNREHNGVVFFESGSALQIYARQQPDPPLVQTTRIGFSQAKESLWRWYWKGHSAVSKR